MSRRVVASLLVTVLVAAVVAVVVAACGGGDHGIAVESSGPVTSVDVTQSDGQLVVRWEHTAASDACRLDYELASGDTGSRSFGAMGAVRLAEQVFDVPGGVVSATLVCT